MLVVSHSRLARPSLGISHLVVLDSRLSAIDILTQGLASDAQAVVLDGDRDSLAAIAELLPRYPNLQSLHLIAHGEPGTLHLGATPLNLATLDAQGDRLRQWSHYLNANAEILLYGCRTAAGELGRQFAERLHQLTGAAVAASTRLVGRGQWHFDRILGQHRTPLPFTATTLATYPATFNLTNFLYASGGNDNEQLFVVDLDTGDLSNTVSLFPSGYTVPTNPGNGNSEPGTFSLSRRFNPSDPSDPGLLYYFDRDRNTPSLYSHNPATGANALIGTLDLTDSALEGSVTRPILKMAHALDGTIYAMTNGTTNLYVINPDTGALTNTINVAGDDFTVAGGDIAFSPDDETVLYATVTDSPNFGLYTIDIANGKATRIGNITNTDTGEVLETRGGGSLAFGADDNIYVTSNNRIFRVNPSNGNAVLIGATEGQTISDFASLPIPAVGLNITVEKEDGKDGTGSIDAGGEIRYTVTIENNGVTDSITGKLEAGDIEGIGVSDLVPADVTNVTWVLEIDGRRTDSGSGNTITDTLDLPAGETAVYRITGTLVDSPSEGSITNKVEIKAPPGFAIITPEGRVSTLTDSDTVNINNRPPVAQDDTSNAVPGEAVPVTGLIGIDPENDPIASYTLTSLPSGGTLIFDGETITQADIDAGLTIPAADIGKLQFRANAGFDGSSFQYTATDSKGGTSEPATITLNDPPTASGGSLEVPPGNDTILTPTPLSGDDDDGTISGYRITELPDEGQLYIGDPDKGGELITTDRILTPEERSQVVFRAESGFDGDTFEFVSIDDDGATSEPATVTLTQGNAPPETNDNVVQEVSAGSTVTLTGLGGSDDTTPTTGLEYKITSLPDNGTLTLSDGTSVNAGDTLKADQLANLQFSFPAGFDGSTSFEYAAIDADGNEDPTPGQVFLKTPDSNIPPETDDSTTAVPPNTTGSTTNVPAGVATPITGLGGNDPDGDIQAFRITEIPSGGQLFLGDPGDGGTLIAAGDTIPPDRIDDLFFLPGPGFSGGEFEYAAIDNNGVEDSTPATVTLTQGNQLPETDNVTRSRPNAGQVVRIGDRMGGSDDENVAFFRIDTLPASSTGILYLGHPDAGGVPVEAGATLTPAQLSRLHFQGGTSAADSVFTYSAIDNEGGVDPTPGTVRLTSGNIPPETDDATVRFSDGDAQVPISGLGGSDEDGEVAFFTIKSIPPESEGVLFLGDPENDVQVQPGQRLSAEELNQLVFVPGEGFSGTVTFTYTATDNLGVEDETPATVTLTTAVPPTPEPPDIDDLIGGGGQPNQPSPETVDTCCPPVPEEEPMLEVAEIPAISVLTADTLAALDASGVEIRTDVLLDGSPGDDVIDGGASNDEIQGREGDDRLQGFEGDDYIQGGVSRGLAEDSDRDAIAGNQGSDFIGGNQGDDTIYAGEDDDIVYGGRDNDRIWGDRGSDTLSGDLGDDAIAGDELFPTTDPDADFDLIYGNDGNDSLAGNTGDDTLAGNTGNDLMAGGKANDLLHGNAGNDFIQGNFGDDTLVGSDEGGDPAAEADELYGNPGRDVVLGGVGVDTLHGGKDDDWVDGGGDNDLMFGDRGADTIYGNSGNDTIAGRSFNPNEEDPEGTDLIYGGSGNDDINGNEREDTISGGDGEDLILGGKQGDLIRGDRGADTLKGELGDDTLVGSPDDTLEGVSDNDAIAGNNGNDVIQSGHGDDLIYGGRDNDLVHAGADNDRVFGDRGDDTLHGNSGNDTITGGTGNPISSDDVDADLIYADTGDDVLLGSQGNDSLVAGEGNDVALGGRDDDILWGEDGNDRLLGDLGGDTLCGNAGDDTLVGANNNPTRDIDGDDLLCGGSGNDLMLGNEGTDTLCGGRGNDTMFGGEGDDSLSGDAGSDLLFGDRGTDTLFGGAGADGFGLSANSENNLVRDFTQNEDYLQLVGELTPAQLNIVQVDSNTVIQLEGRTLATLENVTASEITESDFR